MPQESSIPNIKACVFVATFPARSR